MAEKNITKTNMKGSVYPEKRTVNFAIKENNKKDLKIIVPVVAAATIALLLFLKFGVVDILASRYVLDRNVESTQKQVNELKEENKDYSLVELEYQSYNLTRDKDGTYVNVTPIKSLDMLEKELLSVSHVQTFAITTDTITVKYGGVDLNKISQIYNSIKASELVDSVQVYTASNKQDNAKETVATMTIILKGDKKASSSNASGAKAASSSASSSNGGGQSK